MAACQQMQDIAQDGAPEEPGTAKANHEPDQAEDSRDMAPEPDGAADGDHDPDDTSDRAPEQDAETRQGVGQALDCLLYTSRCV